MKRTITTVLALCTLLVFAACAVSKTAEPSMLSPSSNISTTPELSFEEQHREVLKRVYNEMPGIAVFVNTVDFEEELGKQLKKENETIENDEFVFNDKSDLVDPFSERLLAADTPEKILPEMHLGEIVALYGYPNYQFQWFDSYVEADLPDWNKQSYYYLEDGNLMCIVYVGRCEFEWIDPVTSHSGTFSITRNHYHNFYVQRCYVLSVDELLEMKDRFSEKQWDPRDEKTPFWIWSDWPEIFVTKYGFPETYVPADDGNGG